MRSPAGVSAPFQCRFSRRCQGWGRRKSASGAGGRMGVVVGAETGGREAFVMAAVTVLRRGSRGSVIPFGG